LASVTVNRGIRIDVGEVAQESINVGRSGVDGSGYVVDGGVTVRLGRGHGVASSEQFRELNQVAVALVASSTTLTEVGGATYEVVYDL